MEGWFLWIIILFLWNIILVLLNLWKLLNVNLLCFDSSQFFLTQSHIRILHLTRSNFFVVLVDSFCFRVCESLVVNALDASWSVWRSDPDQDRCMSGDFDFTCSPWQFGCDEYTDHTLSWQIRGRGLISCPHMWGAPSKWGVCRIFLKMRFFHHILELETRFLTMQNFLRYLRYAVLKSYIMRISKLRTSHSLYPAKSHCQYILNLKLLFLFTFIYMQNVTGKQILTLHWVGRRSGLISCPHMLILRKNGVTLYTLYSFSGLAEWTPILQLEYLALYYINTSMMSSALKY